MAGRALGRQPAAGIRRAYCPPGPLLAGSRPESPPPAAAPRGPAHAGAPLATPPAARPAPRGGGGGGAPGDAADPGAPRAGAAARSSAFSPSSSALRPCPNHDIACPSAPPPPPSRPPRCSPLTRLGAALGPRADGGARGARGGEGGGGRPVLDCAPKLQPQSVTRAMYEAVLPPSGGGAAKAAGHGAVEGTGLRYFWEEKSPPNSFGPGAWGPSAAWASSLATSEPARGSPYALL